MGKLKRRSKNNSGDGEDLYVRRTGSSETHETVKNLLELEWADAPGDGDPLRSVSQQSSTGPISRQGSIGSRQLHSPVGRPISQPAPVSAAHDLEPVTKPESQSKSMLALLSATFPEAPSDDLTQSAIQLCEVLSPLKHIGWSEQGEDVAQSAQANTRLCDEADGEELVAELPTGPHETFSRPHKQALASSRPFTAPEDSIRQSNMKSCHTSSQPQDDALENRFLILGSSTGHTIARPTVSRPASKEGLRPGHEKEGSKGKAEGAGMQPLRQIIDQDQLARSQSTLRPNSNQEAQDAARIMSSGTPPSRHSCGGAQHTRRRMDETDDGRDRNFSMAAIQGIPGSQPGSSSAPRPGTSMDGRGWARAATAVSDPIEGMPGLVDLEAVSTQTYDVISHTHTSASKAFAVRGAIKMPPRGLHNNVRRANQAQAAAGQHSAGDSCTPQPALGPFRGYDQHPLVTMSEAPAISTYSYGRPDDMVPLASEHIRPATALQHLHLEPFSAARNAAAVEARREQLRQRKAQEASRKERQNMARQHLQTMRMQSAREEKDSRWKKAFIRRAQEVERCREVATRTGARPCRSDNIPLQPTVVSIVNPRGAANRPSLAADAEAAVAENAGKEDGRTEGGAGVAGTSGVTSMELTCEVENGDLKSNKDVLKGSQGLFRTNVTRIPVSPTVVSIVNPRGAANRPAPAADAEAAVAAAAGSLHKWAAADSRTLEGGAGASAGGGSGAGDSAPSGKDSPDRPSSSFQTFSAFLPGGCGAIPLRIASSASPSSFGRCLNLSKIGGAAMDVLPSRPHTVHSAATRSGASKQHAQSPLDGLMPPFRGDMPSAGNAAPAKMLKGPGDLRATSVGSASCTYVRASPLMVRNNLTMQAMPPADAAEALSCASACAASNAGRPLAAPDLYAPAEAAAEWGPLAPGSQSIEDPFPEAPSAPGTVSQQKRLGPIGGKVGKPRVHTESTTRRLGAGVQSRAASAAAQAQAGLASASSAVQLSLNVYVKSVGRA